MIVPFFPPTAGGGVYRSLGFVKHLPSFGWRTTVVSPRAEAFWIRDDSLLREVPAECAVRRTGTLSGQFLLSKLRGRARGGKTQVRSSRGFGALRKLGALALVPDTYVGWYPFAVREARRLLGEHTFDAIYSSSPPETSHLIARAVHRASGLPWVADFRDPWMNLHLLPAPTRAHAMLHEKLERSVCERAAVVVTNRWHFDLLRGRYPGLKDIRVIPNGYDGEKLEPFAHLRPEAGRLQILHAGMLTQKRSAVAFLQGLKRFLDAAPTARRHVRVIFAGARESRNDEAARALGLFDVVEFLDTVTHSESLRLERTSHILLLIKHLDRAYDGIVPGKLYEYIGARRPILALVPDGEVKDMVRKLRRGEVVSQDDPEDVARALRTLYEKYAAGALEREYDLSERPEYTRKRLAGALAEYLESCARGNEPR